MHASRESPAGLAALPAAGVPADHGVASLGLVMQLAGRTTGALGALAGALALVAAQPPPHAGWFWLALALAVARSHLHARAGRALSTVGAGPADPFAATRRYAVFAIAQALALGWITLRVWHVPARLAAGIAVALALWPAVLASVAGLRRFSRLRGGIPLGDDRGLEAAAILMTVLGSWGALAAPAILLPLASLSPHHVRHGWSVMLVVVFALLVLRSALHLRAGLAGLREVSLDRPSELTARYAAFGVISAFCVGGVLTLLAMSERLTCDAIAGVAAVCWLLVAWPTIIERYFRQRQFAELFAGDRAPHRRACDGGLTGLGWLLAAHATAMAAALVVGVAAGPSGSHLDGLGAAIARAWRVIGPGAPGLRGGAAAALIALEASAAIALIRMSAHRRSIATVYAVIAGIAAALPGIAHVRALDHHAEPGRVLALLPVAIHLVLPTATFVLVRRLTIPAARAWYRTTPDLVEPNGPTQIGISHVRDSPVPRIEA